jgi:hypothetical protein
MLRFLWLLALVIAPEFLAFPAIAQPAVGDPIGHALVRLRSPLTLRTIQDLDFGIVAVGDVVGTQIISLSDSGTLSGCVNGLSCYGPTQSALFEVTDPNGALFMGRSVTISSVATELLNSTGGRLTFTPSHISSIIGWRGRPGQSRIFRVGGSITLSATTEEGVYQGDIEITVNTE